MTKVRNATSLDHIRCPGRPPNFVQKSSNMKWTFLFLFLAVGTFASGQASYLVSNFSMKIKGTSNLHDWESSAYEVRANGTFSVAAGTLKAIQSLYMEIPVKAIKSTKGSMMDNKTYDALKADANPNIIFKLEKVLSFGKRADFYDINVVGNLTLAGTTQKIDMYVQGRVDGNGNLIFTGSKKLKMTDFKINPPTALLGTLTTGNEVEIDFQVTFKPI